MGLQSSEIFPVRGLSLYVTICRLQIKLLCSVLKIDLIQSEKPSWLQHVQATHTVIIVISVSYMLQTTKRLKNWAQQ